MRAGRFLHNNNINQLYDRIRYIKLNPDLTKKETN
jgi:hypothetical protein